MYENGLNIFTQIREMYKKEINSFRFRASRGIEELLHVVQHVEQLLHNAEHRIHCDLSNIFPYTYTKTIYSNNLTIFHKYSNKERFGLGKTLIIPPYCLPRGILNNSVS